MSLITRFLLLAFTDHLVIFCCGTSLPLVSFTRFILLAISSTSFFIHARGLIYFTHYCIRGHGLLVFYFYSTAMLMLARRVFIGLVWSTWTMSISTYCVRITQGGSEFADCVSGYSVYAREVTVFSSGIFGWISCYNVARDSNDFNAQPLF
jgi:hypothetical protein